MISMETCHHSHPGHKLKLVPSKTPYICSGCKTQGFGPRYVCESCDYYLHNDCAFPISSTSHAFYKKCTFKFLDRAPDELERWCDACGMDIEGFVYHCKKKDLDLHPCCLKLPWVIESEEVKLDLCKKVSSNCFICRRKELWEGFTGWSYRSRCKKYHIHVSCVKDMLVENWIKDNLFQGDDTENNSQALVDGVPDLQLALQPGPNTSGGRFSKYWRIAKFVIQVIVSTILGDPTALISGFILYLASS